MSTMQRLTLIGLFNYDPSLFDGLSLPADYDKQTFIDSLLLEHGEKCVLYADPAFMKFSIGAWGRKWALELERIAQALKAEYDPIYNYDRFEEYEDNEGRKYTSKVNAGRNGTNDVNASHKAEDKPNYNVVRDTNEDATVEHTVSADNSSSYSPDWKETQNGGKTTETASGKTQDLSETSTSRTTDAETSNSNTEDAETKNFTHKAHLYGNIGVTTSAQMVTEVVQQRFQYNLYGTAARLFANELLIGIY